MCMRVELNQAKNGFLSRFARSMKSSVALEKFLVRRLHALLGERAGVRRSSACPTCRNADLRPACRRWSPCIEHAARAEAQLELGVLRIVGVLRLVLGIEVVEIAEELIEAVNGRQELVAVAEMVLAELSGHVALRLEQIRRASGPSPTALPSRPAGRLSEARCAAGSGR